MNGERTPAPPAPGPEAAPIPDRPPGTGEGSGTALEALIRKRRLQGEARDAGEAENPSNR